MPTLVKLATYFKKVQLPKGRIDRGKYRIVRNVTQLDIANVRRDVDRERRNMFYLRNPFVSVKELDSVPKQERQLGKVCIEKHREKQIGKFLKCQESRKIEVFLKSRLGTADKWE
ncbi:uncharacterized protein LOC135832300 [Planococcus citri]|uniref:uncharacterized protein LOC135832300 n=1 Tax=Planococcus citri TaxID=170843 RepID=UPI0031F7F3BF